MTNLTVSISDDRFAKLRDVAGQLQITPEELVAASIEDLPNLRILLTRHWRAF